MKALRHIFSPLVIALIFSAFFWIAESYIHVLLLKTDSWYSALYPSDLNELWMRFFTVGLLIFSSYATAIFYYLKQREHEHLRITLSALNRTHECVIITDKNNKIIYANPAYERTTGYTFKEVKGKNPNVLKSGKQSNDFYQSLWDALYQQGHFEGEMWNRKKDGTLFPEWININTICNDEGKITHHIAIFSDATERKKNEERIQHYAFYDPLTECPNRRFFIEHLNQAIKSAKRASHVLAVIYIDLDHFKAINDQYGHDIGDQYLCAFSATVKQQLREEDTLSRFGGDEFVILLPKIHKAKDALHVADKILNIKKLHLDAQTLNVHCSIGIACFPDHANDATDLIKAADTAMYDIKKQSRNGVKLYDHIL